MSGLVATTRASTCSSTASVAQDRALVAKLLQSYQAALNKGQSTAALGALAKQITDAAKLAGQNVTLPKASSGSSSSATASASPADPSADPSKVDLRT